MSSSNPKSLYNQPDYNAGSSKQQAARKPDEITSAGLIPPPPYSAGQSSRNSEEGDSSVYGSVRSSIEQQQHGLLAPASPRNASQTDVPPPAPTSKRNWNPHSDYQPLPTLQSYDAEAGAAAPSSWFARRRAYQDPGCCRKWCKYIIAALLLWLVIYMYSGKLTFSAPHHGERCNRDSVQWKDMPDTIDFEDNVELVIEGRVSNGLVTVIPLGDRHGGTILTDVKVYPPSLQKYMSFDVQQYDNNGDTTKLTIHMPQQFEDENEDCINVNMEIRLPYGANRLSVNVKNMDVDVQPFVKDVANVEIKTRNGRINFERWSGESLRLSTTNGEIKAGRLISDGSVYLENDNALVQLTEDINAKKVISIQNANGAVEAMGSLRADDTIKIETSNTYIKLSQLFADHVTVSNANGYTDVDYIEAKSQVLAKSSNGPMSLSVGATKNNQVKVINSNARIDLHMTEEFEGSFVMTASDGFVNIENDDSIDYQDKSDHLKRGTRRSGGKGHLIVETSNDDINVAFDIK
ncbi:serine/threonine protein kinase, AGC [Mucor velutinosus]|uniref:Serine/threonine protein kinase, AGC n=1 Tax=Mucor velutinosus TaxID=708070 RepID=A0AAN7HW07_9FUNG|nr:serine/threonine protein kinase, AGC [Mucor velutinosus]